MKLSKKSYANVSEAALTALQAGLPLVQNRNTPVVPGQTFTVRGLDIRSNFIEPNDWEDITQGEEVLDFAAAVALYRQDPNLITNPLDRQRVAGTQRTWFVLACDEGDLAISNFFSGKRGIEWGYTLINGMENLIDCVESYQTGKEGKKVCDSAKVETDRYKCPSRDPEQFVTSVLPSLVNHTLTCIARQTEEGTRRDGTTFQMLYRAFTLV